jgi:mutator protein MutT
VPTPVAIAIVLHDGCYLVGRRGPDGPLAGYSEFPGGKCAAGETAAECAVRECLEETGLRVGVVRLRREVVHTYSYGPVHLHFFDCRLLAGTDPHRVQPAFQWVPRAKLAELRFPEPNRQLLDELIHAAGS